MALKKRTHLKYDIHGRYNDDDAIDHVHYDKNVIDDNINYDDAKDDLIISYL